MFIREDKLTVPGQPRCTWVNALPGSTRGIFLMKNIFRIFFRIFFQNIFKRIFSLKNKDLSPKNKRPYYQVRTKGLYVVLDTLESVFSEKRSLSRDKASELSQVERSPTCIGADAGDRDKLTLTTKRVKIQIC